MYIFLQVSTLAQGKSWDEKSSPAQNYTRHLMSPTNNYSSNVVGYSGVNSYQSYNSDGYQSNGGYQNYNSTEFKDEKEAFFSRLQYENASRRKYVILL